MINRLNQNRDFETVQEKLEQEARTEQQAQQCMEEQKEVINAQYSD